jgi:hypothetical protein
LGQPVAAPAQVSLCAGFQPPATMISPHAPARAEICRLRLGGIGADRLDGINGNDWRREHLAGTGNIPGALAAGEQATVSDAVEARRQHVHEKAADELVGGKRHRFVPLGAFDPVILPLEGDAFLVTCDQAAVRDGDTVGVAGEITQDFLRTAEGVLAVDDPLCVPQRRQIGGERARIDQSGMLAEERQCARPSPRRQPTTSTRAVVHHSILERSTSVVGHLRKSPSGPLCQLSPIADAPLDRLGSW